MKKELIPFILILLCSHIFITFPCRAHVADTKPFIQYDNMLQKQKYSQITEQQRIKKVGENLYIATKLDTETDILYWFKKCMYNDLYTFYRVGFVSNNHSLPIGDPSSTPTDTLNLAYSDNIGPFAIENGGWCGGNHSYLDSIKTAYNVDYRIFIDGKELNKDTIALVNKIEIKVTNHIMNPTLLLRTGEKTSLNEIFCTENVDYMINRNNIQVSVQHVYKNKIPVIVNRYYGMQSMFENEKELLTINGKYTNWTPISQVSEFIKKDYPDFHLFIEKSAKACQSSYLFQNDLGNHAEISDTDIIFIGNSYGKCYHKLIADRQRKKGDVDSWSGVYTWFKNPIEDNENLLIYKGMIHDKEALFVYCKKAVNEYITVPVSNLGKHFTFYEKDPACSISVTKDQSLKISSTKACCCIIIFSE